MTKGKFIVIEGLDGTGKTTKLEVVTAELYGAGKMVHCTNEPTDRPIGKLLRRVLSGEIEISPQAQAALFTADRVDHCTAPGVGIADRLERGEWVVSSRYYYSTLAYQGMVCGFDELAPTVVGNPHVIKPDLCIFLDAPPEVCVERINARRGENEIFENVETLTRVREAFYSAFERLGEDEKPVVVNTDCPAEEADEAVRAAVRRLF